MQIKKIIVHAGLAIGLVFLSAIGGVCAEINETCPAENVAITTTPALSTYPPAVKSYLNLTYPNSAEAIMLGDSHVGHIPTDDILSVIGGSNAFSVYGAGDGTNNTLWRLNAGEEKLKRMRPQIVIMMVGTNNTKHPPCAIIEGLKSIIVKTESIWPEAAIYMVSLLPRGVLFDEDDKTRRSVNTYFSNYKKYSKFTFVQVDDLDITCGKMNYIMEESYANLKRACVPEQAVPQCKYYIPDHIHLTKDGYDYLGKFIAEHIRP